MAEPSPIGADVARVLAELAARDLAELAAAPPLRRLTPADLAQLAEDLGLDAGELARLAGELAALDLDDPDDEKPSADG
jgi:hypothetical protein